MKSIFRKQVTPTVADKAQLTFQVREAYKNARANIAFSLIKQGCKKVIVSSSLKEEGKTTTSINLAITFAKQVNTKVLIIDCDLRKPKVNRCLGIKSTPGLTNVISDEVTLYNAIKPTNVDNLYALCSGTIPPNPSELLSSESMKRIVAKLEKEYDYIVFDTPPINIVSDSLCITSLVDGIILTAKENSSTYPEFHKTIETLERTGAKILGVIIVGVDTRARKYGSNYEYEYKYKDGELE